MTHPVVWYRIEDWREAPPLDEWENPMGASRTRVGVLEYPVVRETPKGVWLEKYGERRFVRREGKKRFACPTFEEAMASFLARKAAQVSILTAQIRHAETAISLAQYLSPTRTAA